MTPRTDRRTAPDPGRRPCGRGVLTLTLLLAAAAIVVPAAPAQAVPPGDNGLIVYADNYDIKTIRPDGSDEHNLTAGRDPFAQYPRWSPDGTQIAFQK